MHNRNVILLNAANLDSYLAAGMYRLGCMMFTTKIVEEKGQQQKVHWLRYKANQFVPNATHKKLLKASKGFTVTTEKLFIDDELEQLYTAYRNNLAFEVSPSLKENLFDYANYDAQLFLFESLVIKIYDADTLIAAGIFDNGSDSIAGIINFYNPAYKKYSLGKLLMLHKMLYTTTNNKPFYYPGYVIESNTKFDYKFFLGKNISELWDAEERFWYDAEMQKAFGHVK
jgi:leucyl-tRNA---protein transferase